MSYSEEQHLAIKSWRQYCKHDKPVFMWYCLRNTILQHDLFKGVVDKNLLETNAEEELDLFKYFRLAFSPLETAANKIHRLSFPNFGGQGFSKMEKAACLDSLSWTPEHKEFIIPRFRILYRFIGAKSFYPFALKDNGEYMSEFEAWDHFQFYSFAFRIKLNKLNVETHSRIKQLKKQRGCYGKK